MWYPILTTTCLRCFKSADVPVSHMKWIKVGKFYSKLENASRRLFTKQIWAHLYNSNALCIIKSRQPPSFPSQYRMRNIFYTSAIDLTYICTHKLSICKEYFRVSNGLILDDIASLIRIQIVCHSNYISSVPNIWWVSSVPSWPSCLLQTVSRQK